LIGLWAIIALATWRDLVNGPRVGLPWTTYDYGQALLFEQSIQIVPVLGVILWNVAAAILGYWLVIRPVFGHLRLAAPIWLVVAGNVPGMLILIALARIVTLLVPGTIAPMLLLLATFGAALFALLKTCDWRLRGTPEASGWAQIWAVAGVLLVTLVFTVHVDRAHVVAEGSVWFITDMFLSKEHGIGTGGQWPLVSQHYDEAAFLYPVIYGLMKPGGDASATLTVLYWITLAFGRVGVFSVTYLAIRSFGVDRLSVLILLAFFCGASLSLNPISSRVLFDSLSPLAYVLHVNRVLSSVLPILLIAAAAVWARKASTTSLVIATMLGIGLSSMTIHIVIVLLWGVAVVVLTAVSPEATRSSRIWRAACITGLTLLAIFTIVYGLNFLPAVLRVALLLVGAVVAGSFMVWTLLGERASNLGRDDLTPSLYLLLATCAGYTAGILLLGNFLAQTMQPILSEIWPWSRMVILERFYSTLASSSGFTLMQSPYCHGGYEWGFRMLTGHCGSLAMFARTYGLAFVAMTFVCAWWLTRLPRDNAVPDRMLTLMLWGILLSLLAMPIGFVAFDFVSPLKSQVEWQESLSGWLRSRLVEPWFYGGTILALALFLREAGARQVRWAQSVMMVAVALFALSPLVAPAQLVANFAYLFGALVRY
jgi:hypothetical protein